MNEKRRQAVVVLQKFVEPRSGDGNRFPLRRCEHRFKPMIILCEREVL